MALRTVLEEETFKTATLNLVWLDDKVKWDPQAFQDAAAVLRILADDGPRLAAKTDKEIVDAVEKVLQRFVPGYKDWNDPILIDFLRHTADFFENAAEYKPVDSAEVHQTHAFCESMWATLAHIKNREMRNGKS